MTRKIAAGNWKMNGTAGDLAEAAAISEVDATGVEIILCPPATLLDRMRDLGCATGGQDCHPASGGAHTGDVAAGMLVDAGAKFVILGHSERRTDHGENSETVAEKTTAAWTAGLQAIVCVGETESQRDAGETLNVVTGQLSASLPDGATQENTIVAYEPVWAIGTGRTATPAEIDEVHAAIRASLSARFGAQGAGISLLYGGSVKAANAAEIFAVDDVDGALVGGASLKARDFAPIVEALAAS